MRPIPVGNAEAARLAIDASETGKYWVGVSHAGMLNESLYGSKVDSIGVDNVDGGESVEPSA